METSEIFYLTLPSNVKGLAMVNTTSKWLTPMVSPITLSEGVWEVCLSEIHLQHSWFNITPKAAEETVMTFMYPKENFVPADVVPGLTRRQLINKAKAAALHKSTTHKSSYTRLTEGHYLPEDIVRAMNAKLSGIKFKGKFIFDKPTCRMGLILFPHESISTTEEFSRLLGFKKTKYDNDKVGGVKRKKLIKASRAIDLDAATGYIYIYSNIVKKMLVGDIYAPLLRVITVSSRFGDRVHKEFRQLFYHDVAINTINSIEISLRDDQGMQVPFQYGKTIVTLHFRKKSSTLFQ